MTADERTAVRQAVLLGLGAEALLTLMDALIKGVSARYPTVEIAFLRFASGALWATVLIPFLRPGWPSRETIRSHLQRSILVVITASCFFFALGRLPLAETVALSFLSPVLMAIFGSLLLQEKIDRSIVMALLAGLAGMALIVGWRLGRTTYEPGALVGVAAVLLSAVTYALNIIVLRTRAQRDPALTIVWFQSAAPAVLLAVPAAIYGHQPSLADIGWFLVIGALGVAGHFLLANAFARAEAARLAPIHYTSLLWGTALGYFIFAEVPTATTIAGAVLIAGGAWLAQRRPLT